METFFEELGLEVVLSDFTSKKMLNDGVKSCVDEACLPIKVFYGHIINIKDRVDYLFIPRFTSISREEYICPKIGGLPDMVRSSFKHLPTVISTEVNLRKNNDRSYKSALEVGMILTDDKNKITKAYKRALKSYGEFKDQLSKGKVASDILGKENSKKFTPFDEKINLVLIGHEYTLNDSFINMNLLKKLREQNVNIVTIDSFNKSIVNEKSKQLDKKMFWNFGRKALGSALHLLDREDIDGVIYIMTFGCGVDSFISNMVERRIRNAGDLPFTVLTIDEHSGEAGINTRIEAFIDMIRWRKKNENYIPSYG